MTAIEEKVDQYNTLVAECNTLLAISGDKRTEEQRTRMWTLDREISDLDTEIKLTKRTSTETVETREAARTERTRAGSPGRMWRYRGAARWLTRVPW